MVSGKLQRLGSNSGDHLRGRTDLLRTTKTANIASSMVCTLTCPSFTRLMPVTDDLPVIRDNIKKGFLETQTTVNKWMNNLKKKIDGEEDDDFQRIPAAAAQGYDQYGGRRSSEFGRRSADRERYDADPQVIGDDFSGLQLHDAEGRCTSNRRKIHSADKL